MDKMDLNGLATPSAILCFASWRTPPQLKSKLRSSESKTEAPAVCEGPDSSAPWKRRIPSATCKWSLNLCEAKLVARATIQRWAALSVWNSWHTRSTAIVNKHIHFEQPSLSCKSYWKSVLTSFSRATWEAYEMLWANCWKSFGDCAQNILQSGLELTQGMETLPFCQACPAVTAIRSNIHFNMRCCLHVGTGTTGSMSSGQSIASRSNIHSYFVPSNDFRISAATVGGTDDSNVSFLEAPASWTSSSLHLEAFWSGSILRASRTHWHMSTTISAKLQATTVKPNSCSAQTHGFQPFAL